MADFSAADLRGARFDRADLTGAQFFASDLSDARFRGADMTRVTMSGVELVDVDISGEIMNVTVNGVDIGPLIEAELDRDVLIDLRAALVDVESPANLPDVALAEAEPVGPGLAPDRSIDFIAGIGWPGSGCVPKRVVHAPHALKRRHDRQLHFNSR